MTTNRTSHDYAEALAARRVRVCGLRYPNAASQLSHNGNNSSPTNAASPKDTAAQAKPLTAQTTFAKVSTIVSTAKLSGTVTADNDPNHLLGRSNQYTSKITFDDTRISASDVSGTDKGDVERGGAIEVFGGPADAQARAKYIQSVTKSMPMFAEYDYVHGAVLVRVSHYLTPKQAADYKTAANNLD